MILIQISSATRNKPTFTGEPDFSVENAKVYFALFMPGVSAGLICFVVFGTTKTYGDYFLRVLIPDRLCKTPRKEAVIDTPGSKLSEGGSVLG
jgi:hypothetical protein